MAVITPQQFRASVDARLAAVATSTGRTINRTRNLLVMERFLVRMVAVAPGGFVLKGGLALELRLARARTTADVDVLARGMSDAAGDILTAATRWRPDPDDHLAFHVEPNRDRPTIDGDGVRYQGRRFRLTPTIAGRPFGDPFGVDMAVADAVVGEPEVIEGSDFFVRYGMLPLRVPVYPLPTHLAEKLHALTLPRTAVNTRLKDLVDIALLAEVDGHESEVVRAAIRRTFVFRGSHPVPVQVPDPPAEWVAPYARMRTDERLTWATLDEVVAAARLFFDPLLVGACGRWVAATRCWTT
jgi:hypothetical protein